MRSRTSLQWSSSESSNMWKMPFSNQGSFLWPWNLASSWFFCMLVCVYVRVCMPWVWSQWLGGGVSLGGEPDVHLKTGKLLSGEQTFFWAVEFWWNSPHNIEQYLSLMLSNISYQQLLCCSQISYNINVILDIQIVWATIRYIVCEKEFTIICD